MNAHALRVLEFPRVLDAVAGFASSERGAARVRSLEPVVDVEWLDGEHARVAAMRAALEATEPLKPEPIPDLEAPLNRLRVEGSRWTGPELLTGGTLLRSSRRM